MMTAFFSVTSLTYHLHPGLEGIDESEQVEDRGKPAPTELEVARAALHSKHRENSVSVRDRTSQKRLASEN